MIWLPVIGFLVGFCAIFFKGITVPSEYASYLSLAAVAGIDTILGGIRSGLEGRFKSDIFLSGFIVNTLTAVLLAYFGDKIGMPDLYLAAVVALGWRILLNLSLIRRHVLGRTHPDPTVMETPSLTLPFAVGPSLPANASSLPSTTPITAPAPGEPRPDVPVKSPVEAP